MGKVELPIVKGDREVMCSPGIEHSKRVAKVFVTLWISTIVVLGIYGIRIEDNANNIEQHAENAVNLAVRVCERAREFSPSVAVFYKDNKVFTKSKQKEYENSIPNKC